MRCASCGFENPKGKKFCEECGTTLERVCPSCGSEVRPTAKFCGDCGTTLGAEGKLPPAKSRKRKGTPRAKKTTRPAASPVAARSPPTAPEAERRQLTVIFCDLVGSTALSEQLDPEEYRAVLRAYHETCAGIINRYVGHTAQHLGDGLLVYFGYPAAHEDDAQRAVRTGLEIVQAVQTLPLQLNIPLPRPLQVRIGIHTGLVVVGEIGSSEKRETLALGETPNIAARIQGLAEADTVVISGATYRLVQGLFECHDRGPQALKGVSNPVPVYRVLSEGDVQSRFEAAVRIGLTPLVGREEELGLLRRRWEQAKGGDGQVVLLSGEPGIGKSRLMHVLKDQAASEGATRIEFRCSPYYQNSALYPVIDHLQRLLQWQPEESAETKLEKLQQTLVRYRFPQAETVSLLAALLSLPPPADVPPLTLSPKRQKQRTQEALVAWLVEEAERQTVYCVWEDLHWVDPSTLELLTLFLAQAPTTRVLVLLTFRPEFIPPWQPRAQITQLTLNRLGQRQVEAIVTELTGGKALPREVLQQIVAKTDGVPLFVEELTKTVVESDLIHEVDGHYELSGPLPPLAIPSTLQDSLMARLDRLATVREIAQVGATIGREFNYNLLQAVSPLSEGTLQQGLKRLVEAGLVYQSGVPPQARYLFKHALVQDTAYQSLLRSRRSQLHQQVAQVLTEQFAETVKTQPELVAHHYTEAGSIELAIPYWQQAGQRALQRSAHAEAVGHLTKGLELLKTLLQTQERTEQELVLQTALGPALMVTTGYTSAEVEQTYTRALELCRQVGGTPQLFPVLRGLWEFYEMRGELQTARELAEQLLTLTQNDQDPALLVIAHDVMGDTLFWLGEFIPAREHLEQGIALYDFQQHRSLAFLHGGYDPGMACLCYLAFALWHLGYPDQAVKRSQGALTLAQELAHPFSLAMALYVAGAWLSQFDREVERAQEQAEALIALATEQEFSFFLAQGTILRGWALAMQGQGEKGIAEMHRGIAAYRTTGTELLRLHSLALLAEVYGKAGHGEEGLTALAEALALIDTTGERWYEAELYRLKGELTLQSQASGPRSQVASEAEECFHRALDIARTQQAKSLELRAVMSLSRLWQQQGKREEAHQLLAKIYGWFTEGFDTKDLQEAKALLEELT